MSAKRTKKISIVQSLLSGIGNLLNDGIRGLFGFVADLIKRNLWILIILFAANYALDHKINLGFLNKVVTDDSTRLKTEEGEVASAIVYTDDQIIIIQKKGEEPKEYTGVKEARLTKFEDGEVKVRVKNKGLGLEPGLVLAAGDGLRLGMDVEYAYWKRFGLLGGVTVPVMDRHFDRVRGHLGLSYDIPNRWLSHTSVFGGVDTNKTPIIGMRSKFGGGWRW